MVCSLQPNVKPWPLQTLPECNYISCKYPSFSSFLIAGAPWLDALCLRALALDTGLNIIVFHPIGLRLYPGDLLGPSAETLHMAFPLVHEDRCYDYLIEVFERHTCFLMYDGLSHYCSAYVRDILCADNVYEVICENGWRIWDRINSLPVAIGLPGDSSPAGNAGGVADTPETSAMTSAAAALLQIHGQSSPVAAQPPKRIRKPPSRYND